MSHQLFICGSITKLEHALFSINLRLLARCCVWWMKQPFHFLHFLFVVLRAWWLFCEYLFRLTQHLCGAHHSVIFVGTHHSQIFIFFSRLFYIKLQYVRMQCWIYWQFFSFKMISSSSYSARGGALFYLILNGILPLPRYWFINVIQHAHYDASVSRVLLS